MNIHTPSHIAIIPDGNRRWAKKNGLSVAEGHRKGFEAFEPIIQRAAELNIAYVTFWAFSTENWKRTQEEVGLLLQLFQSIAMSAFLDRLQKNNVRLKIIGDLQAFPQNLINTIKKSIELTKDNDKITVTIGLNYGGRDEILRAVNKILAEKRLSVSQEEFSNFLDTAGMPEPDLIIRTGGEQRLSGLLPWQGIYSELHFTDLLWPEFSPSELDNALEWYSYRERRMGK